MSEYKYLDVIIVGGSYSGLAASMTLGRALRKVLVIDSGLPCNRQTPKSHNFLTQDGISPKEISTIAKRQVMVYDSVKYLDDLVIQVNKLKNGFEVKTQSGKSFLTAKIIFATGIKDIMPSILGFEECWGISVLHCPYCHGYEVRNVKTGILGNGEIGFELAKLILNWSKDITIFTNGKATFSPKQMIVLNEHKIKLAENGIQIMNHKQGQIKSVVFKDNSEIEIEAFYTRLPFKQHNSIPELLGCALTEEGYLKVDAMQKTNVYGIYASGDNVSRMRTVANAVAMGTTAGMMVNKELIEEKYTNEN